MATPIHSVWIFELVYCVHMARIDLLDHAAIVLLRWVVLYTIRDTNVKPSQNYRQRTQQDKQDIKYKGGNMNPESKTIKYRRAEMIK